MNTDEWNTPADTDDEHERAAGVLCTCCAMLLANDDRTTCDYWRCAHTPLSVLPEGEWTLGYEEYSHRDATCAGCGESLGMALVFDLLPIFGP